MPTVCFTTAAASFFPQASSSAAASDSSISNRASLPVISSMARWTRSSTSAMVEVYRLSLDNQTFYLKLQSMHGVLYVQLFFQGSKILWGAQCKPFGGRVDTLDQT